MNHIGSSLSRNITDLIPKIYHRPQESSGVKVEITSLKTVDRSTYKVFNRSFENPAVNSMRDFEIRLSDNLDMVRRYVLEYNHEHRRAQSAEYLGRLRQNYLSTLEDCNLCWKCKKPLKQIRAKVHHGKTGNRANDEIVGKVALPPRTAADIRQCGFTADSVEIVSASLKRINRKRAIRSESHFKPTSQLTTEVYSDVKTHFETRQLPNGKWVYVLVDGTGILKGIKFVVKKNKKKRIYFRIDTGKELPKYRPASTYRVFSQRCLCKAR